MAQRKHPKPVEQEFTFRNVQLLKNETLGTGSYGAVCKAKCDQLICAAKLLYPVLFQMQTPDPGKEHRQPFRRFEQECRFLSRVNHPNIVQYLGTYRDPETNAPVLLMELMDESLTHFLESSPGDIPHHIQVNLSQDVAQALAFLHANGIIHRDLSSNNVLLIACSRAKVSDFGMSRFTDVNATRLATMTQCPGTPAFMSPEALDEPPVYTEKLDNFSFGVLLIQIVTRQFPAPSDRFETVLIPSPRNPNQKVRTKLPFPEVERRQAHINLIEPTHPLLPIALECLKDEAVERPSSQQLCQSLDALKRADRFELSLQQNNDNSKLVQENDQQSSGKEVLLSSLQNEIASKNRELQDKEDIIKAKDLALQQEIEASQGRIREKEDLVKTKEEIILALQQEIETSQREIQDNKDIIKAKDGIISVDKQEIEASQRQIRDKDDLIKAKEGIISALQREIEASQRQIQDKEDLIKAKDMIISANKLELLALLQEIEACKQQLHDNDIDAVTSPENGPQASQITLHSKQPVRLEWEGLLDPSPILFCYYFGSSAVVGDNAYFTSQSDQFLVYNSTNRKWSKCSFSKDLYNVALVNINNELTTVGGHKLGLFTDYNYSNKVYSYENGDWKEKYPPMPTKRSKCAAVFRSPTLIVAGGNDRNKQFTAVEILHTQTKQWSSVSSLPVPMPSPSLSVHGEHIYITYGKTLIKCSYVDLILSRPKFSTWTTMSDQVRTSTIVNVKGHLLAVGGESYKMTKDIHEYDPDTFSWYVVGQMNVARSECAVALLPNNKLLVLGKDSDTTNIETAELATIL